MKTRGLLVLVLLLAFSSSCLGDWLGNVMENAGKRLGNRAVNDAGNSAYDTTTGAVKGIPSDGKTGSSMKSTKSKTSQSETVQESSCNAMTIEEAERVQTKFRLHTRRQNDLLRRLL